MARGMLDCRSWHSRNACKATSPRHFLPEKWSRAVARLNAAIRKHGWESFRKEVILPNVPRAGLPHWEQRMIATHGTLAPKGYNLTPGGETSPMLNPEVQKRAKEVMQSAAVVAKRQKAFSSPSFLAKVSKESKAAWDGYTVEDRNARAQHMAAAARRGWVEKREGQKWPT